MSTVTDLYQRLSSVINNWQAFTDQQREWLGGPSATDDTNLTDKGKRELTDSVGNSQLVETPAELVRKVNAAVSDVTNALPTAQQALDTANTASATATNAQNAADAVLSNVNDQLAAAQNSANEAENSNIASNAAKQASEAAQAESESARDTALTYKNAASASATAAASSESASNSAKTASQAAQLAAETAQAKSETAQTKSETAQTKSETAQAKSETAQAKSETAQAASEAAQLASESARDTALTYKDAAGASEINAANSASSAADSLATAQSVRDETITYKDAAAASANLAQSAKTASENAQSAAEAAATAAANSAAASSTSAAASASAASDSADSATESANSATASANSATASANSATASANSATASANSATASANSATASALSESNAAASESAASLSEANALASKNAAKTSETNALSSKNAAASSATAASQSATNAAASEFASSISEANSVASAAASESSSQASAASASDSADSAAASLSSANTANDHRLAAATSETNAAASEASALASKNAAKTSETNAAASEASALASKNAAKTSEVNAASSASSALSSKNAASTSETNAASSASDAADSATASANSATASANSATASANSASAANAYRVAAATSDTNAAASAAAAQDSEDSAAADAASALSSKNAAASSATSASNSAAAAATSETNAAASESAAAASEANALSSKNSAASSASTATTKASQASASASAAATSETNAANSAAAASADADRAVAAADSVTNALVPRGDWDASGGVFPTPIMDPERSDFYHITVAGTMVNASNPAQDDISVEVGDQLYWHVDKDVWYKIDNTDRINTVNGQIGDVVLDYSDVGALGASQNAVSASKWKTARTLTLTGDVAGSASIDGSGDVSLSVNVGTDSHVHHRISIEDTRDRNITPNDLVDKAISAQFTNIDKPSGLSAWYTALSVNGWHDGYQAWQILGGSSSGEDNELYFRHGIGTSWSSTQRIFMDDYHPNADKLTTARTLTVGNSAKSFDGSANVSWSLSEMGAVNKAGDTMSGNLTTPNVYITSGTLHINHDGTTSDTLITMDGTLEVNGKTYINNAAGDNIVEFTKKANSNYGSRFFGTIYENYDRVFSEAYHPNADKWTTARTLTLTGDVTGSVSWDGSSDASITTNISTINNSVTIDGGNSTQLTVYSDDAGEAEIRAMGDGQGTGRLFVGQSASYGGGIEYNGDGTPSSTGAPSDSITLFRVAGAGKEWTAYNPYSSNHWYFRGLIHVDGNQRVFADNYHPNADKWTTARTITLGGDATGSVSIDGSSNVSLNVTIADDSHNHVISNVDGLQSKLDSKVDLSGDKLTGRLFGAAMVPNMINNSYMNLLDGSKPAGWYSTGVTIEAVSPYTKAFEGPYWPRSTFDARTIGVDVTDDPELATESMPYWFGVYDKGDRIQRGGLRDGWHSTNDGNILKVSGTGLLGQRCYFYPTYDSNQLGTRWMFSAWVKCVKGKGFSVGVDAGYFDRQTNFTSKATIDAGPEGWLRISKIINTAQVTSIDGLVLSMAFNADDNGDIEGYIALPYVANIDYTGTNEDSWAPSLSDTLSRKGLTVLPDINGNGGVGVHNENPAYPLDVLGDLNATAIREDGVLLTDKYLLNNGTWTGGTGSSYTTLAGSINSEGNSKFTFYANSGKMDVITDGEFYANDGANKVYHSGNKPTASDVGALPSTGGVMSGTLNLAEETLLFYGDAKINRSQNPGSGLIPGSNNSLNLYGPTNGHVSVILSANNTTDSFNVVSSEGTATSGHTYTRRAFWVHGQGHTFAAGNMYANVNKRVFADNYHPNADKWTTARTITLGGDATGSVSLDGSANVTLTVAVANDSHTHDGRYYTEAESNSRFVQNSEVATSGTWDGIINKYLAKVTSSGVLEIARYLDFHTTGSTADYDARLDCTANGQLKLTGALTATSTVTASSFVGEVQPATATEFGGIKIEFDGTTLNIITE